MKDELNSVPMKEFIALNPKVYSFRSEHENVKKLKGISKVVVKKEITHEDYKIVLETGKSIDKEVTSIRSINHDLFTLKQVKTSLTAYSDKLYMIDNNNCVPYGYYKI